jgi:ATP-binding cassette subfamily F protein 3
MVQCGYYSQHQSEVLSLEATVIQEIRRQSDPKISEQELRSVLGLFLLGEDFWEKKVGELSGGEKNRLVLSILFLARANFLILDEPTNHLDMESREALVSALENYSGTVLLVAHDRYLLAKVAETIWEVQNGQVNEFQEGYSAYMARVRMRDQGGGQPATTTSQRSVLSRRDQRRMEAEERNRINSLLKPKQLEYQRLERELEAALAEHEKLEQTLADPETYKNPDQLQEMTRAYQNAENRGEELMTRLAYLERDIQEIQAAGRQG